MRSNETVKREKRKHDRKTYGLALAFVLPFVLFFVLFTLLPLLLGIGLSFFDYDPNHPEELTFVGIYNYLDIFGTTDEAIATTFVEPFWRSLLSTILFDLIAVPLLIVIPMGLAYLVEFHPPGYKFFRAIIYMPVIVSITVAGMMFTAIFGESSTGLINGLLGTKIRFLTDTGWRWFVMVLLSIWWQTGTNFVILSAGLKDIPKRLYEACETDGGGKLASFLHVTLPNLKGQLSLCLFSTIINYLNLYGQPTVIRSASVYATQYDSPMMLIEGTLKTLPNWTGFISAMAVVFGIIVLVVAMVQRYLMSREKGGHKYEKAYAAYKSVQK